MNTFKQFVNLEAMLNTYREFQHFTESLGYDWIERNENAVRYLLAKPPTAQSMLAIWNHGGSTRRTFSINIRANRWTNKEDVEPQFMFSYPRSSVGLNIDEHEEQHQLSDMFVYNFINNMAVMRAMHAELVIEKTEI
jgi:hypothetical protein